MTINEWYESSKIEHHPDWVRRWHEDPFSVPPLYLELSPSGACNHRCTFCAPEVLGYKTRFLDAGILAERFSEMREIREADPDKLGFKSVQFAGEGEPFLHKRLDLLCESARKAGIDVGILTNGVAMTPKRIAEVLPHINGYVQISVNAGAAESYSRIHECDVKDWERLWGQNIPALVRTKAELRSPCEVGVNMTVLVKQAIDGRMLVVPPNWPEAMRLTNLARDAGLDFVCFKPYSQLPQSRETMRLYGDMSYAGMMDEILETGAALKDRYQSDSFEVVFRFSRFSEYEADRGYNRCPTTPTLWSYVQADGVWVSCPAHWLDERFHLGNLLRQTVGEIWFGDTRSRHLEFMLDYDVSVCRRGCHTDKQNRVLVDIRGLDAVGREAKLAQWAGLPFPHRGNFQ